MATTQRLLELRNKTKKRKPTFVVRASKFARRIKVRWRRARGRHSAIRQDYRGRPKHVSTGYRSPQEVRGKHSSGLEMVVIHTDKQLSNLDPTSQGAIIGSTVSARRRVELMKVAVEKKIRVLNVRDLNAAIGKIKAGLDTRQKARQERIAAKSKKEEEKKKQAEEKKKKEEKKHQEEKAAHEGPAPESVEEKVKKEEEQKEQKQQKQLVDKEITKRQ
ncbi:MAG: large subunit ribosomal protein L32e [archaeon GW2011_AR9]|nr:MAG: large subunit ribosomal protein L32e [archaeon GW2011_AR9]MBS3120278.1 hypothetical protein [Candidatus Woesearchaeota archaeon]HIG92975.1 hypothetical protein [Candidatus Woesearchaeota archaeon]HIH12708.1 hypothetical protein [Candidatus Woesearchaeota archaeon]